MAIQTGAFQNLVLFFLNDINATNKEILKIQTRQLALLEAIKDNLYSQNTESADSLIEKLHEAYQQRSEMNIQAYRDLFQKDFIEPNTPRD